MTKKPYCPMTIEHEALMMNQAIAASCIYMKMSGTKNCEDCGLQAQGLHTFSVFTGSGGEIIGVSNQNAPEAPYGGYFGSCGNAGIYAGMAILQTDGALDSFFDPVQDGSTTIDGVVLHQIGAPADANGGFWYDSNGNIVYNATS